ncbi:MAG: ABC transporter permease [Clostridiales bacterium]|nr:ABC transporter permease [Clostridiales bacterium]
MAKFLTKRILLSILILFFVMFIIYVLMYSLPSSYIENTARNLSQKPGTQKSAAQWIAELNAQYGMDKGVIGGFMTWMKFAVRGEFGESWYWTTAVTAKFNDVIWYSFTLAFVAFILEIVIAVPLGVIAARKQYSGVDYTVTVIALIGISLPTFFVATILKMIFAVKLGWLDISGMQGRYFLQLSSWGKFIDLAKHFIMPALTLVIISIGSLMRYTRTNMLEVLNADYIRTARAKGLPEKRVISYHAFRNTLIPLITILGASLPTLFGGALITETLFSITGIGFTSYTSMINGDIPFTMFYLAFSSVLVLVGNLIADILYAVADPRVRVN